MILKTHAIALRADPFSRTSQIVSWLTPERGRLVTMAKGSQRARSELRGQIDVFYTCEVVYYSASRSGLSTLKECAALVTRDALRTDIKASACASYLCAMVHRLTPPGAPQDRVFDFMERCLDALCEGSTGMPLRMVYWAELRLMGLLGMAPRFDGCTACGQPQSANDSLTIIAIARGGMVCRRCCPTTEGPLIPLGLDSVAILKSWQEADLPSRASRTVCSSEQRVVIEKTLGALLSYHLELPPAREVALDLLAR